MCYTITSERETASANGLIAPISHPYEDLPIGRRIGGGHSLSRAQGESMTGWYLSLSHPAE